MQTSNLLYPIADMSSSKNRKVDRRQRQIFLWLRYRLRKHNCRRGDGELFECSKYIHKLLVEDNEMYTIFHGMLKRHIINMLIKNEHVYRMCFQEKPHRSLVPE